MRYLMFLLALLFTNVANAMECEKVPDCASLGYSTEPDQNCADNGYMYCPFDQNYKVCVQYDCAKMGFTESDKSTLCADLIECKGNSKMTLCQKACIATNYDELKDLAESGKCKLITMKNDITIPLNQGITLAQNTIIDGGGHTLQSSGNKGFNVYTLNNNTGFKNIFIKHNQTETQYALQVFLQTTASKSTLQNVQVEVKSDDTKASVGTFLLSGRNYEISGKFTANFETQRFYTLNRASSLTFKNADISITTRGSSSDGFYNNADFINSHGTVTTRGVSAGNSNTLTFENSNIHLNATNYAFWANSGVAYPTIRLKDNAELRLTFKGLLFGPGSGIAHIKFESSENAPAKLIVEGNQKLDSADVTANNTANTLVLNGVTYHPKKATTTLLSEIPNSGNWEVVQ